MAICVNGIKYNRIVFRSFIVSIDLVFDNIHKDNVREMIQYLLNAMQKQFPYHLCLYDYYMYII